MSDQREEFEGWAILELMGHRKLAGYVRPATLAGAGVIRIDVPRAADQTENVATQFYSPNALYCLTPVSESIARNLAACYQPEPVSRWELPASIDAESEPQKCSACGCTEQEACEAGCFSVEPDLCSECG